ncbi:hypothetical protein F4860DRAFT_40332 [Xylaria cubensis]|nr:hypothetical protein F4860DRAFT_40332 [Xylaria cubensis]
MTTPESPHVGDSDDSVGIYVSIVVLAFFATLSVTLRFWARRLMCVTWQIDDYLALIALLVHHGTVPIIAIAIELGGLGQDTRLFTMAHPSATVIFYQVLSILLEAFNRILNNPNQSFFIGGVIYAVSSPLIKLSALSFYWRIFPTKTIKLACIALASLIIIWTIVVGVVDFLLCKPLHAFWNLELQKSPSTKCIDVTSFWLVNSGCNGAIDLATLILPIHEVIKLHSSISKKIGICAVFLLGSVALAASLTRTITTIPLHNAEITNPNKQFIIPGVATVVEVYVAIIGACLPTLVPVYRRLRYGDASRRPNASYSKGKTTRNIKTIGQISYRSHSRPVNESSTEALRIEHSFHPLDYQHIPRYDANGTVDCEAPKESPSDTICFQEIRGLSDRAWMGDNRSAV